MAVSEDGEPGGARRRQSLRERERRLLERERLLLERERRLLHQGSHTFDWVGTTAAGTFWSKLNAVDFMNSSLQFAALAVVCLFPFLITVSAESGGDARHALIARLGLDQNAARDVDELMSSGSHSVTTLSVIGAIFVLLGAMGIASTLQVWYQRVYDQPPAHTLFRQLTNRLLWLGGLLLYLTVQDFSFIRLKQFGDARVPIYAATFILAVAFYWWTPRVLLLGRIAWRRLLPAAVATAVFVTGLGVFSAVVFSPQIVSSHADYGSIGVVMVLLSYLIGLGVCIHLGAVAGRVWDERRTDPPADHEELSAVADR